MNPQINKFNIEVAFATPSKQTIMCVNIDANTSVLDAIRLSNIVDEFPEFDFLPTNTALNVGVFGKKIDPLTYKLKPNDRIEIYRILNKTPNQKRLERASQRDKQ